jgi:hypothetical protein
MIVRALEVLFSFNWNCKGRINRKTILSYERTLAIFKNIVVANFEIGGLINNIMGDLIRVGMLNIFHFKRINFPSPVY